MLEHVIIIIISIIMQMMLKCADIGHLAADGATHKRWAYQLEEEMFRQVGCAHHQ